VPSMVPSQNNPAPAFTTTGDFRKPVVEALDAPHEPSQFSQDGYLPYHSHQLPPRSPFDTLLTAVNLASDIEAPVPRGRNDSVLLQLDAQVLAAERAGQYLPAWAFPPHQYENSVEDEQRFHHSNVAYGQSFGTSPIYTPQWMDATPSFQMRGNADADTMLCPANLEDLGHVARAGDNATNLEHHLRSQSEWELRSSSMSPGPEKKRWRGD
jgi:hypothetical protein